MKKDKVKVKGYFAWSLMDNFEWARGYSEKFGLHQVNFSDPARPRIPKKSALWYTNLIKTNGWEPLPPTTPQPQKRTTSASSRVTAHNTIILALILIISYLW